MATCSASSGGSLTQLIALGAADITLTQDPSITFWRFRYNKYTNFSMESIEQPFGSQTTFGSDVQLILNRTGDLAYFQYVLFDLPGITVCQPQTGICGIGGNQFPCCDPCDPCSDGPAPECICPQGAVISSVMADDESLLDDVDTCTGLTRPWAHYVNAIGQFLIRRASVVIGGQVIDTMYNDFLYAWEELSGQPGKRLFEMIGKRLTRAQLVADSKESRRLYVPLPFWYTMTPGNALPLVSLQFHGVQIHCTFAELKACVQVSDCDVLVVKCADCQPLTAADLGARLETLYVYLDVQERDKFATGSFQQLIVQHQSLYTVTNSSQIRINLNFNHPMIELIWLVRRQCQSNCNNHFNFSGKWGRDPVRSAQLNLNGLARFCLKEGRYFRLVQPYQWHTDIPDAYVYSYSFAIFPEDAQPSGSCNFSRIDNVELILNFQPELQGEQLQIMVFGRNWNQMTYRQGLGGLSFAN